MTPQEEMQARADAAIQASRERLGSWIDGECFYVSCIDGPQFALLAGPFKTHQEALDRVDEARKIGCEVDSRAWFYAFGTCKTKNGYITGKLNERMGL